MLLKEKTALITGCLKGIGNETMKVFAKNGCNIFACCQYQDNNFEESIKTLIEETGVSIIPIYFDLTNIEQIKINMKKIVNSKQKIDILVNIAGATNDSFFHMTSLDNMKMVFDVNFFSQMIITQYISKLMVKQNFGSIIMVSSITAIDGNPGQLSYSASKAALIGATKTLASEFADKNIRVNAIAPGIVNTDMISTIPQEIFKQLCNRIPMKRIALPLEIAGPLLFLASDLSSYITGQILRIDGGIG